MTYCVKVKTQVSESDALMGEEWKIGHKQYVLFLWFGNLGMEGI